MRRGISLLEVLISMFVMLVGLLGVAALLPVGKFEVQRGNKIDRSSACGRAAFRDFKVRGFTDPRTWCMSNSVAVYDANSQQFSFDGGATTVPFQAVMIDPLGVGDGDITAKSFGNWFPFSASSPTDYRMPRLTVWPLPVTNAAREILADSVFRCADDVIFDEGTDADALPSQVMQAGAKRLSTGDYSWLVTIVPEVSNIGKPFETTHKVSVAVFYKRDLSSSGAGERVCDLVNVTGNGEVSLSVASATDPKAFLDVKPTQWFMVASCPDVTQNPQPWSISWQRLLAADEIQGTGPYARAVTLAGADQQFAVGANAQNKAFLVDGVIAVYEKSMRLELDSLMGN